MDTIPELLKNIIGTVVRNAGTPLVVWLAAKGWITTDDGSAALTVIVVASASLVWGVWNKLNLHALIAAALRLPAHSTIEEAKNEAKL